MKLLVFSGNLGNEPELRISKNGVQHTSFSLAINRFEKEPIWIYFSAFHTIAENLCKYVEKGDKLLIQAHLDQSQYESQGRELQRYQFIADYIEFHPVNNKEEWVDSQICRVKSRHVQ